MALDLSVIGQTSAPSSFTYTWKDAVLYALGVGAKKDELDYLYEGRGPKVLPSFAVVPSFQQLSLLLAKTGANLATVVHGAQLVEMAKPFTPSATLITTAKVRAIYDLRKFANVVIDGETKDGSGEMVCKTTWTIICRGEGGFDGEPPPKDPNAIEIPKDTPPSFRIEEATTPEQALLYRLSGDPNPLHADPEFAKAVGFERGPILHGLCTYGHMVRHIARGACEGDAQRITAFNAQFRRPVWPGDTLVTEGWIVDKGNGGPGKLAISVKVKERDEVVISGAWATFR